MEGKKEIDFSKKFNSLMGENNTYEFFLKMQYVMPKYSKKKDPIFFSFLIFAIEHLAKYKEDESISSLFIQSMQLYLKNHPDKKIENPSYFMNTYHKIYKMIPVKSDKSLFKYNYLELCDANGISEDEILKENIYYEFAVDSRENKFLLEGYKFAMKSMKLDIINDVVKDILETDKYKMDEKEKKIFVARTCLELLVNKDKKMAMDFIIPFINAKDNYETNEPLINMAYFICLLLNDKNVTFEKFKEIINMYKPNIEKVDILLKKYINKISFDNYNQLIFPEANNPLSGFNIMGMMKLVGNLSNLMRGN
jgi:hypothetical protein